MSSAIAKITDVVKTLGAALMVGMARLVGVLVTATMLGVCPVAHAAGITLPCLDFVSCPGPPTPPEISATGQVPGTSHLDLNLFDVNFDVGPLNAFSLGNSFAAFGNCFNVSPTSEGCFFFDTLNNPANHWHWETRIGNTTGGNAVLPVAFIAGNAIVAGFLGVAGGSFAYIDFQFADLDVANPVGWQWLVSGLPAGMGVDTSVREFVGVVETPPLFMVPFTPLHLDPPGDFFIFDLDVKPTLIFTLTQIPEPSSSALVAFGLAALMATAMRRRDSKSNASTRRRE